MKLYHGKFNYYGEVHQMWTNALSITKAKSNFITRLVDLFDLDSQAGRPILNKYFNGSIDNYTIKEVSDDPHDPRVI